MAQFAAVTQRVWRQFLYERLTETVAVSMIASCSGGQLTGPGGKGSAGTIWRETHQFDINLSLLLKTAAKSRQSEE
jgi:hypothetical protein